MATITNINAALNTRLSGFPSSPPVAWPNTRYSPVLGTPWLRPTLLPTRSFLADLNGTQQWGGIYQIDIFVPVKNGIKRINDISDQLLVYFKAQQTLTAGGDRIGIQAVSVGMTAREEEWYHGFIEVFYVCFS